MKILDSIYDYADNYVYLFFDNVDDWLNRMNELYEDGSFDIHLWYHSPMKWKFTFLWVEYPCVKLWYDNELHFSSSSQESFQYFIKSKKQL